MLGSSEVSVENLPRICRIDLARYKKILLFATDMQAFYIWNLGHWQLRSFILQNLRMPLPLSLRKSAMVLKSGAKRPVNHISSTLRWHSRSRRRLDWMRLR